MNLVYNRILPSSKKLEKEVSMIKKLGSFFAFVLSFVTVLGFTGGIQAHAQESGTLNYQNIGISGRAQVRNPFDGYVSPYSLKQLTINGIEVFCLEPSIAIEIGDAYIGNPEETINVFNRVVDPTLRQKLERIAWFGFFSRPGARNYVYTQFYIWESLGYEVISVDADIISIDAYKTWREAIEADVENPNKVASFSNQVVSLQPGESVTLTDTNNVLKHIPVPNEKDGYIFVKDGNNLTITATENAQALDLSLIGSFSEIYEGVTLIYRHPGKQTLARLRGDDSYSLSLNMQPVLATTISTVATTVKGAKVGHAYENHKEVVDVKGLRIGGAYTMHAIQYDSTGKEYARQTRKFVANERNMQFEFEFSVPEGFKGHIVYGEELYLDNDLVAKHYDLTNKNQTVEVVKPEVVTDATTKDGAKEGYADEIHYETFTASNLVVGDKYLAVAKQYDATGKELAKQEFEFVAKEKTYTHRFEFTVPKGFSGYIVYGEDLYHDGNKVAVHFDLKNKRQTIKVLEPKIGTVAKVGGKSEMVVGSKSEVADTLQYENFKSEEVMIRTWIVKHGTDEKISEVFERIVKLDGNGQVVVSLDSFDTSKLPVGEYTLMEQVFEVKDGKPTGKLISQHTDNKDKKQTIIVKEKPTVTREMPQTGSADNNTVLTASAFGVLALGAFGLKRNKNEE